MDTCSSQEDQCRACEGVDLGLLPIRSELRFGGGAIAFRLHCKRPNWWWRFWQFAFFGFRWKQVEVTDT